LPVPQSTSPAGACDNAFVTQTLVGVLPGFGTASGAPKRQPAAEQLRLLPVCADVTGPIVATFAMQLLIAVIDSPRSGTANGSGTELPPPPV